MLDRDGFNKIFDDKVNHPLQLALIEACPSWYERLRELAFEAYTDAVDSPEGDEYSPLCELREALVNREPWSYDNMFAGDDEGCNFFDFGYCFESGSLADEFLSLEDKIDYEALDAFLERFAV